MFLHSKGVNNGKSKALLVGLKQVDPDQYFGWDGSSGCWGCELDVDTVAQILHPMGYEITMLKTSQATHDAVLEALRSAAVSLEADDIFVFYYSGHGGQQPDKNSDELDGQDETLVVYDQHIIDDELNGIWLSFKPGVRIVMLSDSCNSGTNYKDAGIVDTPTPFIPVVDNDINHQLKAQMIHFGGCRDGFTSAGYEDGGAFTLALARTWKDGAFQGNYNDLLSETAADVKTKQKSQYNEYGSVADSFRNSRPFQIEA